MRSTTISLLDVFLLSATAVAAVATIQTPAILQGDLQDLNDGSFNVDEGPNRQQAWASDQSRLSITGSDDIPIDFQELQTRHAPQASPFVTTQASALSHNKKFQHTSLITRNKRQRDHSSTAQAVVHIPAETFVSERSENVFSGFVSAVECKKHPTQCRPLNRRVKRRKR